MTTDEELKLMSREQCEQMIRHLEQDVELYQARCKELEMQLDYSKRRNQSLSEQVSALTLDVAFYDRDKKGAGI
jgi:predicted RNase H-like nuclease (RuvC/YqgF family)